MATDAQRAACRRYYAKTKATKKAVMLRFDRENDRDVIEKLESQSSKADYIRKLVREDIRNG